MIKLRKMEFDNHPVLGDLKLDFCDNNNNAVDTIILAGENGVGKTIVLDSIYDLSQLSGFNNNYIKMLEFEKDETIHTLSFSREIESARFFTSENGKSILLANLKDEYSFRALFSGTEINFETERIEQVTSSDIDMSSDSCKTDIKMANQVEQLIVDIINSDNERIGEIYRKKGRVEKNEDCIDLRINRFTNAFEYMFSDLEFNGIANENNQKKIYFKKDNELVSIDSLSSGEKQIIYRGSFLLKNKEALKGALVLIDEPEISMHPRWQKKIMNYYKKIFTDEEGRQTSQIFAVTHSPFIIHNENRANDKVIVLDRNENGKIKVSDRPEYFKAESLEVVEDSFHIDEFQTEKSTVFVEGKTDEQYFNKTVEVFGMDVPFIFRTVGSYDENGRAKNTGDGSVNRLFELLSGVGLNKMNVCLVDCDSKYKEKTGDNISLVRNPKFDNSKGITRGVENALILDDININKLVF